MASWVIGTFILFLSLENGFSKNVSCPSVCFCGQGEMYVNCLGDELWTVPEDLPKSAQRVELRDFVLTYFPQAAFNALRDIRELSLQHSGLTVLEGEPFVHMNRLTKLYLAGNLIQNVSHEVFEGLYSLQVLDLSDNRLTNIREAFTKLVNVEQLNLRGNKIRYVDSQVLKGLHNLQYLNLDSNLISDIHTDAFEHVTALVHLSVSHNPLKCLKMLNVFGDKLHNIDLTNAGLEEVPKSLSRFVRDLRIGMNNISRISAGDFDSYLHLQLLVLDENSITDLERDSLGRQEYLLRLWLNRNRLRDLPQDLPKSLKSLHMEENELQVLRPYSFKGLVNLEQLFLQKNIIRNVSLCSFCDLNSLKFLDLKTNLIENIFDGVFNDLVNLITLDISENRLKSLGAHCFNSLYNLQALHISRIQESVRIDSTSFANLTRLSVLEMFNSVHLAQNVMSSTNLLYSLRSLTDINIMQNNLSYLRDDIQSFFPRLRQIQLQVNNWNCSRDILWLSSWIRSARDVFYRSDNIRCSSPERLRFRPVSTLTETDFQEESTEVTSDLQSLPVQSHQDFSTLVTEPGDLRWTNESALKRADPVTRGLRDVWNNLKAQAQYSVQKENKVPSVQDGGSLTAITGTTSVAGGSLILLAILVLLYSARRFRVRTEGTRREVRRSGSISYQPQHDEVAILTVSENTVA